MNYEKKPYSIYDRLKYYWNKVKDPNTSPSKYRYAKMRIKVLNDELEGKIVTNDELSLGKKVMSDLLKRFDKHMARQVYKDVYQEISRKRYGDGTSLKNNISEILYDKGYISQRDYVRGFWKH